MGPNILYYIAIGVGLVFALVVSIIAARKHTKGRIIAIYPGQFKDHDISPEDAIDCLKLTNLDDVEVP